MSLFSSITQWGRDVFNKSDLGQAAASYESNLKKFQEMGFPITAEEYVKAIAVPDDLNAGPEFQRIMLDPQLLKILEPILKRAGPKHENSATVSDPEWHLISKTVDSIEKLADKPHCICPRDWSDPINLRFPELRVSKKLIKVMCYKAEQEFAAGNTKSAVRLLLLSAQISLWLDDEGTMLGILVRVACGRYAEISLARMIAANGQNSACLEVLDKLQEPYNFERTLLGKSIYVTKVVDSTEEHGLPATPSVHYRRSFDAWLFMVGVCFPSVRAAWSSRVLERFMAGTKTRPDHQEDYDGWQKVLDAAWSGELQDGLSYLLVNIRNPVINQSFTLIKKERTNLNVLRQAIAAAEIKLKRGEFPAELPLSGKATLDLLYPGKELNLDTQTGFKVWSRGLNRCNDQLDDHEVRNGDFCVNLIN